MSAITLEGVGKTFPGGHTALRAVDLQIPDGELLVLVGPSGSGKTTALRIIAGLESPTAGRVLIDGADVTASPPQDRDLAMVFQSYALYPHKTVRENLEFPLRSRGAERSSIAARVANVARALEIQELMDRRPAQLSGGQRQRVALGRALVRDPRAFLLDEPLSNLDPTLRVQTRTDLALLHRRLSATMVYVTHDQEEAMTLGDRIAVMCDGALQQVAPPMEVYRRPANKFVAGFIGSPAMNFFACDITNGPAVRIDCGAFVLDGHGERGTTARTATLGVRPHDIAIATSDADVIGVVKVAEARGNDTALLVQLDCERELPPVTVVVPSDEAPGGGTRIGLRFRRDRLHLFDAASGMRLAGPVHSKDAV